MPGQVGGTEEGLAGLPHLAALAERRGQRHQYLTPAKLPTRAVAARSKGALEVGGGSFVGESAESLLAGPDREVDHLLGVGRRPCHPVVVGQPGEPRFPGAVERLQRLTELGVEPGPPGVAQRLVEDLADDPVGELEAADDPGNLVDQPRSDQLVHRPQQRIRLETADALDHAQLELPAGHRRHTECHGRGLAQR